MWSLFQLPRILGSALTLFYFQPFPNLQIMVDFHPELKFLIMVKKCHTVPACGMYVPTYVGSPRDELLTVWHIHTRTGSGTKINIIILCHYQTYMKLLKLPWYQLARWMNALAFLIRMSLYCTGIPCNLWLIVRELYKISCGYSYWTVAKRNQYFLPSSFSTENSATPLTAPPFSCYSSV